MKLELNSVFKKGIIIGLVFWASISFGQIDNAWTIQNIAGNGSITFLTGQDAMETGFNSPSALTQDNDGNIYFSVAAIGGEAAIYKIKKIDNTLVKVLPNVNGITGLAFDTLRNMIYFSMGSGPSIYSNDYIWRLNLETFEVDSIAGVDIDLLDVDDPKYPTETGLALSQPIGTAGGIKIHPDGNYLYYSCAVDEILIPNFIQKISLIDGTTTRVVGNNDIGTDSYINDGDYPLDIPVNIALGLGWDSHNDLYFTEGHNTIKKIMDKGDGLGERIYNVVGIETATGSELIDDVPATETKLDLISSGFVISPSDILFICDDNHNVLRRVQLTPLNHDDDEIIRTICGTGESEGDGDVSQDLVGSTFRLARQTNIKPYDVLIDHERLIITDNAKRLRQVFICDYPDISDIAVTPETICIGDSVTLSLSDSLKDAEMWNWYISDECSSTEMPYGHGQSIKVFVENDFDISVSASGGCIVNQDCVTESFELTCKEFYNTFTPNGDGKNDFFEINTVLNYPLNTVSIYNRWGVLLNKIENYDNETNVWTGTNEGDVAVGSGTYFFTFESGGETILSGWIELIK